MRRTTTAATILSSKPGTKRKYAVRPGSSWVGFVVTAHNAEVAEIKGELKGGKGELHVMANAAQLEQFLSAKLQLRGAVFNQILNAR